MGRRDLNRGKKTPPSPSKKKKHTHKTQHPPTAPFSLVQLDRENLVLGFIWDQGIDIIFAQEMEKISVTLEMVRL